MSVEFEEGFIGPGFGVASAEAALVDADAAAVPLDPNVAASLEETLAPVVVAPRGHHPGRGRGFRAVDSEGECDGGGAMSGWQAGQPVGLTATH